MALDIDEDVARKITKFALIGYAFLFFLAPAQPLLCATMMGLLALAPIMLGPNPLRILGLLAFGVAAYLFWPQYQESKKIPARNQVRLAVARADALSGAVSQYVAANQRLPPADALDLKLPADDQAAYAMLQDGVIRVEMKFAPLAGLSLRLVPTLGGASGVAAGVASGGARVQANSAVVISWQCISDNIAQSYLPANCRNSENLRKAAKAAKAAKTGK
jgi:hypothetical protein